MSALVSIPYWGRLSRATCTICAGYSNVVDVNLILMAEGVSTVIFILTLIIAATGFSTLVVPSVARLLTPIACKTIRVHTSVVRNALSLAGGLLGHNNCGRINACLT